ncbi:MAG: acyltransferase [Caulobacterales bacterium]|jgi:peptidoglycan/LPS O-acetylase OafA/YrhL|nr:acyltransferase [Caulobacterales bacterium]
MQTSRAFITLDALRGIAALAVISWHGGRLFGDHGAFTAAILAVDLFFILSGFVLTHAYEKRLHAGMSVASFVRMRLIRLYPLYLLGFLIAGAAVALRIYAEAREGSAELGLAALLNALMLPNPALGAPPFLFHFNFPAWSLFFELIANVLFALFGARLSLRQLAIVVALCGAALIAITLRNNSFDMGASWRTFDGGLARSMFGFFAGVLLYRLRDRFAFTARLQSNVMVCVLALVTIATFLPRFAMDGARPSPELMLFLAMAAYPTLILFAARYEPGARLLPICSWLGVASYAAYVLHVPLHSLGGIVAHMLADTRLEDHAPLSGFAFIVVIGLMAWVADKYWDRPIRAFLSQRFLPARTPPTAPELSPQN